MNRFTELTVFPWGEIRSRRKVRVRDVDAHLVRCFAPMVRTQEADRIIIDRCPRIRLGWTRFAEGAAVTFRVAHEPLLFGVLLESSDVQAHRIARGMDRLLIQIGHRSGREPTLPSADILGHAPCVAAAVLPTVRPHTFALTVALEALNCLAAAYFSTIHQHPAAGPPGP